MILYEYISGKSKEHAITPPIHPSQSTLKRDRFGGAGILVWGGIMLGTDLHVYQGTWDSSVRYCPSILLSHMRLFRGAVGSNFLFMNNNAPFHRTEGCQIAFGEWKSSTLWLVCKVSRFESHRTHMGVLGKYFADAKRLPWNLYECPGDTEQTPARIT